jgi:hypothetical protein
MLSKRKFNENSGLHSFLRFYIAQIRIKYTYVAVKIYLCAISSIFVMLSQHTTYGIILVGGGNAINTTDPGDGLPWDEVARITNASGTHVTSGTAVHLGGGYMLTANHVSLSQGYVSFDGTTTYQISGASAVQVTSGSDVIDLKVFQLTANPGSLGVNLFPESAKGWETVFGAATHVGWGVGHSSTDTDNPWTWGDSSTSTKRWGVNDFEAAVMLTYSSGGVNYDFESLETALDTDASVNEAAATVYDSGSGLFVQDGVGEWFLAGTMVTVSTNGSSTFGVEDAQDLNYSVRIAEYADEISLLMASPLAVPEPSASALLIGLSVGAFMLRRRV